MALLLALTCTSMVGCGSDSAGNTAADKGTGDSGKQSEGTTVEVIRPVSAEDLPAALASCLEDAGFPPSGRAGDGSLEYGPFTSAQDDDFIRADEVCRAQYPLEIDYSQHATAEDWMRLHEHQKSVWVPCMRDKFDVDLGQMPSQEAFVANPRWVDPQHFNLELQQAVNEGILEDMNAWIPECPDFPSPRESGQSS